MNRWAFWSAIAAVVLGAGPARTQALAPARTPVKGREGRANPVRPPKLISFVEATYPTGERSSSTVVLFLIIDDSGRVTGVSIADSGGAAFDRAATDAAAHFVFEPAEVDGRKVPVKIRYVYTFTYRENEPMTPEAKLEGQPTAATTPAATTLAATTPAEIVVRGPRSRRDAVEIRFEAEEAQKAAGTEGDPVKIVDNLPGTARAAFGSGQPILWGSAPEDTRIYIDGVEIPRLFHSGGIRSTVPGDLLKEVTLVPGAYGANYGRGLGGIVRLETTTLPEDGAHAALRGDTLDGAGSAAIPLGRGVRVGIAGRYGWVDEVLRLARQDAIGNTVSIPRYTDGQAKVEMALRPRESLEVVLLESTDRVERKIPDADPAHAQSETRFDAFQRLYLRYRKEGDDGTKVEIVPWVGRDTSESNALVGLRPADLERHSLRWGLRAEQTSRLGAGVALHLGLDANAEDAEVFRHGSITIPHREGDVGVFGESPSEDLNADRWDANLVGVAPYAELDWAFGPLTVRPGFRLEGYGFDVSRRTPRVGQTPGIGLSHLEASPCPRIAVEWRVAPKLVLFAAAGTYAQPPLATDLSSVFGTPSLGLESAAHIAAGHRLRIAQHWSIEATWFHKWLQDLAVRDAASTPKLAEVLVQSGVGRGYGMQVIMRQDTWHGLSGFLSYTLSRAERTDQPGTAARRFDYDQSPTLSMVGSQKVGAFTLGARVRYARGLPRTPVLDSFYDAKDDTYEPVFGPKNSTRLPDFWQVDVRVDRRFALSGGIGMVVYFELLNVTNQSNAEEYYYSKDYGRRGTITGLPIMPVLGVRVDR